MLLDHFNVPSLSLTPLSFIAVGRICPQFLLAFKSEYLGRVGSGGGDNRKLLKMKLTACEEDNNPIYILGSADTAISATQLSVVRPKILGM